MSGRCTWLAVFCVCSCPLVVLSFEARCQSQSDSASCLICVCAQRGWPCGSQPNRARSAAPPSSSGTTRPGLTCTALSTFICQTHTAGVTELAEWLDKSGDALPAVQQVAQSFSLGSSPNADAISSAAAAVAGSLVPDQIDLERERQQLEGCNKVAKRAAADVMRLGNELYDPTSDAGLTCRLLCSQCVAPSGYSSCVVVGI